MYDLIDKSPVLRTAGDLGTDEIAERLGRSANAVRKLWTRALLALRQELESSG